MVTRRDVLRTTALTAGALAMGPSYWRRALAQAPATPGPGPYGPLGAPDAFGLAVPEGFTSRVVAASGSPVGPTGYVWPIFPDGKATFRRPDGGWVLTVNSEIPGAGGASSISFDPAGRITGARRILAGTSTNCGGGATPWGTWLSCEEVDGGQVWECDPLGVRAAVARPALGRFTHEAAAVDPVGRRVYMTEDGRRCPTRQARRARRAANCPRRCGSSGGRGCGSTPASCTSRRPPTTVSGPTTAPPRCSSCSTTAWRSGTPRRCATPTSSTPIRSRATCSSARTPTTCRS